MPRYVAFLRGVMPTNLKMPDLTRCLQAEGYEDVKTLLSSGNVAFNAGKTSDAALQKKLEAAFAKRLSRPFLTFVRSVDALHALIERDPYAAFGVANEEKRVVTFLLEAPKRKPVLPVELDGARILSIEGLDAFSAYIRRPGDPVFMRLIKKTLGDDVTTRTWDTIKKCVR